MTFWAIVTDVADVVSPLFTIFGRNITSVKYVHIH
jgi:hypothetical protein